MKHVISIICLIFISIIGYSQETNSELLRKAESELKTSLELEDYEKAALIKKEIDIRKQIETAVTEGNYELAAKLKKDLGTLNNSNKSPKKEDKASSYNFSASKTSIGIIEPSKNMAVVYFVQMEPDKYEFFDGDQFIGRMGGMGKKYFRYECEPGEHLFWGSTYLKTFFTADLKAGQVYVVYASAISHAIDFKPLQSNDKVGDYWLKIISKKETSTTSVKDIIYWNKRLKSFIEIELGVYHNSLKGNKDILHLTDVNILDR